MKKILPKVDLHKLPGCAVDFIKLVIKKMRYRRKVRADVQAELATDFEEELKDCSNDKEREKKARQLIEEFGDAKLLAVLLRRAKKRCRPLWKKCFIRSLQILGILLVFLICRGLSLTVGTPNIKVDYVAWLNKLVSQEREQTLNARPYYDKAAELCSDTPKEISGVIRKWPADLNDIERESVLAWINANREALKLLRDGTGKPYYWSIYGGDIELDNTEKKLPLYMNNVVVSNAMKSMVGYRNIAYLLQTEILYSAYSGDIEAALNDCFVLHKFGSHLEGKGLLIEQLVGIAIDALVQHTIRKVLEREDIEVPADALKELHEKLENDYTYRKEIINLEAEKAFWYDLIQQGFTDDGKGGGRVLREGLPFVVGDWKQSVWGFVSWSYPDRRKVTTKVESYFQRLTELFATTPWQLQDANMQKDILDEIAKNCFVLKILGQAHSRVVTLNWRLKTDRLALLTTLAVLRYGKEKGQYPIDLKELVEAGYIKELPMDSFSNKSLGYKRTEKNFILYSVGSNFKDDDGEVIRRDGGRVKQYADEGDWVFWPVQ